MIYQVCNVKHAVTSGENKGKTTINIWFALLFSGLTFFI